jgi:hypothetical protein
MPETCAKCGVVIDRFNFCDCKKRSAATPSPERLSYAEWKAQQLTTERCWCGSCWQSYIWFYVPRPLAAVAAAEVRGG